MRIVMMGTGTFAEPTFEALLGAFGADVVGLVTQPQRDGGNKRGSTRQTGKGMAAIAQQHQPDASARALAQPESINSPEGIAALRDMKPDLLVVAAYGQILSRDVLAIPTCGVINVHASLLPKYRGAAPVAYAILNGEKQTGVTIIKVTPGLDSGDLILQEAIDIHDDDTTGSLEARLAVLGAKLAVQAVHLYEAQAANPQAASPLAGSPQDPALVTKAPKIKKEFGLIDWSKPAEEICRHVRAMQPWPTAYTFLHRPGKDPMRVIICGSPFHGVESILSDWPAGRITEEPTAEMVRHFPDSKLRSRVVVSVGHCSFVVIDELQPAGKKPMTAEEFLRGYPVVEGMRFGPEVLS